MKVTIIMSLILAAICMAGCELKVEGVDDMCEDHAFIAADCVNPARCENCGFERGEPTGHIFTVGATCENPSACDICGFTDGALAEHSFTESVTTAPTCQKSGTVARTCTVCGLNETNTIDAKKLAAGDIFTTVKPSVCEIRVYSRAGNEISLGTGFVFDSGGKIVTNYHVLHGGHSAEVIFDGTAYPVMSVLAYDRDADIAVLKADIDGIPPLTVCTDTHPVGMAVYAFGSSQGLTATFSNGMITYDKRTDGGIEYIQHSAAISAGNSGGPLINEYGEVIGINTFEIQDAQNLNFAVSVSELRYLVYGTPKSLADIAADEQSVIDILSEHIIKNGEYDSADAVYRLGLYHNVDSDGIIYERNMLYYPEYSTVSIENGISLSDSGYTAVTELFFDSTDGNYEWCYYDTANSQMRGVLTAAAATPDLTLSYSETNITNASLRADIEDLASELLKITLSNLDSDLSAVSLSAEDLGFIHY